MAYEIIGTIYKIGDVENVPTNKGELLKRKLVLFQRRYDSNTGEEFKPNYPALEFVNEKMQQLNSFKVGDSVRVRFDIIGTKSDKNGKETFFSSLRGFRVEYNVMQQQQPAQGYQPAPPQGGFVPQGGYQQNGGYAPQGGYQQQQQSGGYQSQGYQQKQNDIPFPPPDNNDMPY